MAKSTTLPARFWAKVERRCPDECWEWMGYCLPWGYGQIGEGPAGGRKLYAHRVAYELTLGPIPDRMLVLHHCDNPPCCNPRHLFLGTNRDNTADMDQKGRRVPPHLRGAANGRAVLTAADAAEIRRLHAEGRGYASLAATFGVGKSTISRVVRGEAWAKEV